LEGEKRKVRENLPAGALSDVFQPQREKRGGKCKRKASTNYSWLRLGLNWVGISQTKQNSQKWGLSGAKKHLKSEEIIGKKLGAAPSFC